jgi:hypothetical protein
VTEQPESPAPAETSAPAGSIDAAVRALVADVDQRPIEEHPDVFEQAHQLLRNALAAAGS